ncbi:MAG TPA: M20/M25/M40 family metallo-hydrolase [Gemmatimonadales bacterium]|nr:M20/M25/M40 family metallo-hydrolase [Gemmatimonadales bacterium]
MIRSWICLLALTSAVRLEAQSGIDTAGIGTLLDEALNRSEVMQNLQYLSDVIGPRLSGSPAMRRANEWTAHRFRSYGLRAALEAYEFGVTWERGPASLRITAPFARAVTGHSWAWTEGTGGRVLAGPVVLVDLTTPESLAVYRAQVRGAWVLPRGPYPVWNPDGPAMTPEDSARLKEQLDLRAQVTADTSAGAVAARRQFAVDLPFLLRSAGALGTLVDGAKEHGLMTMSGSPNRISPLPNLVVSNEDYSLLARLIRTGITPRLEARVENRLGRTPVQQWNTVAEIRGRELPGQVVVLGAHLDSWDLGTGVADNGTGSMVVLEAARAMARSGLKPKRTVRFILFSGEEQGLLGSRAYAEAHAATADSVQAVLVIDNGTGAIRGQALQGRADLEELWRQLLAPVASLGADSVRQAHKMGTDHLSFLPYGIPGFNFDQVPRGYNHTHHSESDTYDKAVPGDLRQAAAVMAVTAWQLANMPALLPRGPKSPVVPVPNKPSPGLAAGR